LFNYYFQWTSIANDRGKQRDIIEVLQRTYKKIYIHFIQFLYVHKTWVLWIISDWKRYSTTSPPHRTTNNSCIVYFSILWYVHWTWYKYYILLFLYSKAVHFSVLLIPQLMFSVFDIIFQYYITGSSGE